jgi:hypothetical protein
MILGFVRPVSRALASGEELGQYDQHGKQDGIDKNAPAGCGRPPEQDQSKNAANERSQPQKGLAAFLAHCHGVVAPVSMHQGLVLRGRS